MTAARFTGCLLLLLVVVPACSNKDDGNSNGDGSPRKSDGKSGSMTKVTVSLPESFPKDVPVPAFLTVTSVLSQGKGTMVQLTSGKSADETRDFYRQAMKQQGWTAKGSAAAGMGAFLSYSKDKRECTVSITAGDTVQVTLTVKEPKS